MTVSSSKRTFANPSKFILPPLDSAFARLKMNSSRPSARFHSCWRSWRWLVDWLARTTLYQVSQAQTAGWVKRNKKKIPELVQILHVLVEVQLHIRCCRNILDLVVNKQLTCCMSGSPPGCLTVSPMRSTHNHCTRQASGMTCDSDVMEKPSKRWRGAVQRLADVIRES